MLQRVVCLCMGLTLAVFFSYFFCWVELCLKSFVVSLNCGLRWFENRVQSGCSCLFFVVGAFLFSLYLFFSVIFCFQNYLFRWCIWYCVVYETACTVWKLQVFGYSGFVVNLIVWFVLEGCLFFDCVMCFAESAYLIVL